MCLCLRRNRTPQSKSAIRDVPTPQIQDQAQRISNLTRDVALLDSSLQDAQKQTVSLTARLQVRVLRSSGLHGKVWVRGAVGQGVGPPEMKHSAWGNGGR
jgi:hypothetical protein